MEFSNSKDPSSSKGRQLHDDISHWTLLYKETVAVFLWSFISLFFRVIVLWLAFVATYRYQQYCGMILTDGEGGMTTTTSLPSSATSTITSSCFASMEFYRHHYDRQFDFVLPNTYPVSQFQNEVWMSLSVVAGWIMSLVPSRVLTYQAPGFIFANPWFLLWIRDMTGVIPNIPVRICEYMLGRLRLVQLLVILPVHFMSILATVLIFNNFLPDDVTNLALQPLEYDAFISSSTMGQLSATTFTMTTTANPWLEDFCRQVFITSVFTVAMLVIPVLFQLNHVPRWTITCLFYPLYNFACDGNGTGNTFTPNVDLVLNGYHFLQGKSLSSLVLSVLQYDINFRIVALFVGAIIGGKIMLRHFPDDGYVAKNTR